MSLVVEQNPLAGEHIDPPVKPDGAAYVYWCVNAFKPTERIYADSMDEIANFICGTSADADEDMQWRNRVKTSLSLVVPVREKINRQMQDEGIELSGWELEVYDRISASVQLVYGWGDGSAVIRDAAEPIEPMNTRDVWTSPVPLVLFDFNYLPYTEIAEPLPASGDYWYASNLFVFRTGENLSFIKSLANMGILNYGLTLVEEW